MIQAVPGALFDLTRPPSLTESRGTPSRSVMSGPGGANLRRWKPGSCCVICGEKIFPFQSFNFDHLIPMAQGGKRGRGNKYLAHTICNMVKGSRWPFWLRTTEERLAVKRQVRKETYERLCRAWEGYLD